MYKLRNFLLTYLVGADKANGIKIKRIENGKKKTGIQTEKKLASTTAKLKKKRKKLLRLTCILKHSFNVFFMYIFQLRNFFINLS